MGSLITNFVLGFTLALFSPSLADRFFALNPLILGNISIFLWFFVEAFLLSTWGFTPGKWLLKVTVRRKRKILGSKLSFFEALIRSFWVWFEGCGLGIPLIYLFTLIYSYYYLKGRGITRWDLGLDVKVTHEKIGVIRTIMTALLIVGLYSLVLYLKACQEVY